MNNLKIWEISSSGQKQRENMKIWKFPRESGRLGSYVIRNIKKKKRLCILNIKRPRNCLKTLCILINSPLTGDKKSKRLTSLPANIYFFVTFHSTKNGIQPAVFVFSRIYYRQYH